MKKFKKMKKRILSALMISCMCITILPQGAVTVAAADKEWPGNPYKKNPNDRYTTFDCVYFGHYWYYDTDGNVNQSDDKEPIKWRVLSVDESGIAFLMADRIVDAQPYNKTNKSGVTWENCTLRSWLNGYGSEENGEEDYSGIGNSFFDNAFTAEEKNAILETEVEKKDNSEEVMKDKVYLLSISEVTNPDYGFSDSKSSSDDSRLADLTDYAISAHPWLEYHWYLRSMADKGSSVTPTATLIDGGNGTVEDYTGYSVASAMGVRPVLHLDLKDENVWEPACPVQGKKIVLHRSFGPWHSDPWKDRHEHICADETCVRLDPYNSSASEPCSGGTAGYTKKAICTTCGGEYGALLTDDTPPTGKVSAGTDQWDDVLTDFTFERFYKESKDVTISAEDGESGVASISYYLTERELTREDLIEIESWQPTDADYKEEDDWKETDTVTVTIKPDIECILYAKIVDGVGNTTYLSTDGMVFDGTAPKIEGVEDKGTYCAPQDISVKVTDKYLDSVTLNGKNVALSEDGTSSTFALSKTEDSQVIEAADKAGNHTTVTVTMKEDHSFGEWDESIGENRSKTCENCGQKYTETDEERVKAAKEIVEEFLGSLSGTEDMKEEDLRQKVEEKLAKEGFGDVTATVDEFHKEEASAQTEGSIQGRVTLELREASEDVDFNIPLGNDSQRVQRAKEVVEKTLSEMAVSNDTTVEDIQEVIDAALKEAGLEDVTAKVEDDFTIQEATKESEGKITGTVTLEKGEEKAETEINKTIERLPKTDADYVSEAKKIVEEVLEGMPVTNDTTKEDIQKAIDEALKEAGLSDVTATVDEFGKTEATKEAEGRITGTVTIAKGDESVGVDIDMRISNKGIVKKDTHSKAGAPEADLPMDAENLADAVLTETDRQAIEDGKNINLLLTVESVNDTISTTDKQKVEEGASYYTVGQYMDINLIKMVNTDNPEEGTPVTKTKAPIEIVITIPEELKKDNRSYAVVRVHEGETALLEDMDDDPKTVTIATDRFSTYAMVYTEITHEERLAGAKEVLSKVLEDLTVTNNTTKESIQQAIDAALKEAGFSDVTVTVDLMKKDATREAEGSIVGTVTITKGKASDSVSINKAIAKLPQDNTGNQGDDSTVTPPDSTVITPEQQEKNEFALNEGLKVAQKGKKINVSWGKVMEADGYQIYIQYCGKKFSKPTKEVKSAKTTKVTVTKINGKKLNLKKNYKVYVIAYKLVNGKKVVLGKTITAHIVGKNNKAYTNVKQVKVSKSKYTLKIGRTAKIKARTVLVDKTKKQLSNAHAKEFRYKSTDTGVAVVSAKGKITAKGKGICYIYVYARNGYAKKVKVTVK